MADDGMLDELVMISKRSAAGGKTRRTIKILVPARIKSLDEAKRLRDLAAKDKGNIQSDLYLLLCGKVTELERP